jgi:hypothetical protein
MLSFRFLKLFSNTKHFDVIQIKLHLVNIMKCVMCGKEAEYVHAGMSLCQEHFKWAINSERSYAKKLE